jgi:hypothetical protein
MRSSNRWKTIRAFDKRAQQLQVISRWVKLSVYGIDLDWIECRMLQIEHSLRAGMVQAAFDQASTGVQMTFGGAVDRVIAENLPVLEWLLYSRLTFFPPSEVGVVFQTWGALTQVDSSSACFVVWGLLRIATVVGCLEVLESKQARLIRIAAGLGT